VSVHLLHHQNVGDGVDGGKPTKEVHAELLFQQKSRIKIG